MKSQMKIVKKRRNKTVLWYRSFDTIIWAHRCRIDAKGKKNHGQSGALSNCEFYITQKMLKDTFILVPPDDEQAEIVSHLDTVCERIDATIAKMEEKISNLKDLKIRLVADVVTGKIDVRGVEIPEYEYTEEDAAADSDLESDECYEEVDNDG